MLAGVDDPPDQPVGGAHRHAHATPSLIPTERMAKRRGLSKDEPTIRPAATASPVSFAKAERGLELAVLLEDRLGLDHPLQHRACARA